MVGRARVVDKQRRMSRTIKVGKNAEWKRRAQTGKKEVLYSEEKEPDLWDALLDRGSSFAVVPNRRRTTVRDHRDRLRWTHYLQDLKERARQMLHVNFHVRCVKSNPFRSNQVTKSGGVQGEAECFYYPTYQAKTHRVR